MKASFTPGSTFAGYRVDALVGRGGMGVVYRARDLKLDRAVALKLIAPELAEDEQFSARFLREPRLAASLEHPNVIPIYEAGESEGQLYLAMRFVDGRDLKMLLEKMARFRPSGPCRCSRRSPTPWTARTGGDSSTATSSRQTCSSTETGTPT